MKKKVFILLFLFCFFLMPFSARAVCETCGLVQAQNQVQEENQAQNAFGNLNLEELKNKVIEHRQAVRERFEEQRATLAARLAEQRKIRIRAFFGLMTKRMEAAINRLERLITRMESRLAKIEEENSEVDTSQIRGEINEAKDKLAEASSALSTAKTSLEDVLNADDPKTVFITVRDLIRGIKEQLKDVHQTLVKVIGEMKGLRVGQTKVGPSPSPLIESD
jgi:outer membrane protein TolC